MSEAEDITFEEFVVEKILDRRIVNGFIEYFVKWTGFGDEDNTWERRDSLGCQELMKQYEDEHGPPSTATSNNEADGTTPEHELVVAEDDSSFLVPPVPEANGFDRGLVAEKVLGATNINGELEFLIKWMDVNLCEVVPARIANKRCPQVVIKFYEKRLNWLSTDEDSEDPNQ